MANLLLFIQSTNTVLFLINEIEVNQSQLTKDMFISTSPNSDVISTEQNVTSNHTTKLLCKSTIHLMFSDMN